jgi:hypothetical protein
MEYLLLIANAPDAWDDPGATPGDGVATDWNVYTRALEDAGVLRGGVALHGADIATTVRVRDGERLLVDGPFMEAKDHIVGIYLIDVPDLDTALKWAAKVPNARTGSIEVRPTRPELSVEATLARTA